MMNSNHGINDVKQIYNYEYNFQSTLKEDNYELILNICLEQREDPSWSPDKEQRFICNIDFRMNKNPPIFLFLNQTIANLDIFCTMRAPFNYFSPVPTDTT